MRAERGDKRAVRLAFLLKLLEDTGDTYTVEALAARCGTNRRTIERDLLDLQGPPFGVSDIWQRVRR